MTQAKFYRVSGGSNQHRGVVPDLALPFVVDKAETGESALPNALPWDQIRAASYSPSADLTPLLEPLRRKMEKRIARDPEFAYIREQLGLLDQIRAAKELPLNESARRDHQKRIDEKRLAIENRVRRSRNQEALKDVRSLIQQEEERIAALQSGEEQDQKEDAWLTEAGRILVDLITLTERSKMVALDPAA